jgi:glycosyltransferase involved in cell wall biosynthesis
MNNITALIPNYNQGRFFSTAFESLLKQTHLPNKIIVVDDKSTDDSIKLIEQELKSKEKTCADKHIEVEFIKRPENGGLASCRNTGLEAIKDGIVALLDCDDFYYPDKIKKSLEMFDKFPDAYVVYTDYDIWNIETKQQRREFKHPYDARYLVQSCIVSNNSLIRRSFFDKVGLYDPRFQVAEDYCLWLKAMKQNIFFLHIAESLFCYRENHGTNITQTKVEEMQRNIAQYRQEILGQ